MLYDINEIIAVCKGKNEELQPNSAITVCNEMWNPFKEKMTKSVAKAMYKPLVDIKKRGGYTQVDLIFPSHTDIDMRTVWSLLEQHGKRLDTMTDESEEIPISSLTIVPIEYEGEYYITGVNPIFWVLQPEKIGSSINNVITLLFEADSLNFYQSDKVNAELARIEAEKELESEFAFKETQEEKLVEIEREEREFREERNAKIEALRRPPKRIKKSEEEQELEENQEDVE